MKQACKKMYHPKSDIYNFFSAGMYFQSFEIVILKY